MNNILDILPISALDETKWAQRDKYIIKCDWRTQNHNETKKIEIVCEEWQLAQKLTELYFVYTVLGWWGGGGLTSLKKKVEMLNADKIETLGLFDWLLSEGFLFSPTSIENIVITYIDSNGLEKKTSFDALAAEELRLFTSRKYVNVHEWMNNGTASMEREVDKIREEFLIINEALKLESNIKKNLTPSEMNSGVLKI